MTKEQLKHDWMYCLQQYILADNDDERHHVLKTSQAIYERAVREYGFEYAESLPKPAEASGGSREAKQWER